MSIYTIRISGNGKTGITSELTHRRARAEIRRALKGGVWSTDSPYGKPFLVIPAGDIERIEIERQIFAAIGGEGEGKR